MNQELQQRFARYAQNFMTGDESIDRNLRLKVEHTFFVVKEAKAIMAGEALPPAEFLLGERAAQLHDLSRFEQFAKFHSFRDVDSFDHGTRSRELADQEHWLDDLDENARRDVLFAIDRHNKMTIGDAPNLRARKLAGIIRDADKLDIFRVVFSYLPKGDDPAVTFSLANCRVVTPEILSALRSQSPVDHAKMKSVVDFLAAKIQWTYDFNTATARKLFAERKILDQLAVFLDGVPEIPELVAAAQQYLQEENSK